MPARRPRPAPGAPPPCRDRGSIPLPPPCRPARPAPRRRACSRRASSRFPPGSYKRSQRRTPDRLDQRAFDLVGDLIGWLISVDRTERRPDRVVVHQRFGLALIHLQPLPHDVDTVIDSGDEGAAAVLAVTGPLDQRIDAALAADPARRQPA